MSKIYQPLKNKYVMYGAEFSLYSGKIRSYLRKKNIPFVERLSDKKAYTNFIVPKTGIRYIPVVQTPDNKVIQDTTDIIDELEKKFPENSIYPTSPKQKLAALLLEVYGDEWLLIPAMHYRWNFPGTNFPFIYEEFGKTMFPKLPKFIQRFLGKKIGNKFKNFTPLLGITEKTIPAIEASYLELLKDLNNHFKGHKFLLGDYPCIGDFGLIGPLYAHLFRDPYPKQIMFKLAPKVALWVERMMSTEVPKGEFLDNDEVPETLNPILQRMAKEQIPVLIETIQIIDFWQEENLNDDLPRFLGKHSFNINGIDEERSVIPYSVWMWQRPYAFYHSLALQEKAVVDPWLKKIGLHDALNIPIQTRLKKFNNFLLVEEK